MAPLPRGAVPGELGVEIDIHGARDVTRQIVGSTVGPIEPPAHIEHAKAAALTGCLLGGQVLRGDQDVVHHSHSQLLL